jgi:hypothetical protein
MLRVARIKAPSKPAFRNFCPWRSYAAFFILEKGLIIFEIYRGITILAVLVVVLHSSVT